MGTIETIKFGLSIAAIFTGLIFVVFCAYFMLLGRNKKPSHNPGIGSNLSQPERD